MAYQRKNPKMSKVALTVSLVLHLAAIGGLFFVAAKKTFLKKEPKTFPITMVPQESKPEPIAKAETPKPQPIVERKIETPKEERPPAASVRPAVLPTPSIPTVTNPSATPAGPTVAPAPASIPAFEFGGGSVVETGSDPQALYRNFVEYTLRSNWKRPADLAEKYFTAEVEIPIDGEGNLGDAQWRKRSGNSRWDDSVKKALAETKSVSRMPPKGFPSTVLVRFDVQFETDAVNP